MLILGNKKANLVTGKSIFDYADDLKVRVPTSCGRSGECHECIVEIKKGYDKLTQPTNKESFLKEPYRLACQAKIASTEEPIEVSVLKRQPRILVDSKISTNYPPFSPAIKKIGNYVFYNETQIDTYKDCIYGLAIDLGTTTVAMNLVNLESGEILTTTSFENPQKFGGSDVMNRISYDSTEFQGELQKVIISSINFEIGELSRRLKFHRRRIYEIVIVGNSTMRDIFFGLNVQTIGEKPYKSTTELEFEKGTKSSTTLETRAKSIGLRIFPNAPIYGGPLIGCHIGSDIAAGMATLNFEKSEKHIMLIDIGTNTEVVIGNSNHIIAASCPAGPAFEGNGIVYGMPGYDGAIEKINIANGTLKYQTIGGVEPQGICGSGLIDLLANLRNNDLMNPLGVFKDKSNEYIFAPEQQMSISRSDISILAQAKSANYCGQYIALRSYGIPLNKIEKLYLAGGFANYISIDNAIDIGFLANIDPLRIEKIGNSALHGATILLLSKEKRSSIEQLVPKIEHIELETTPDFFDIFVEGCQFKPMIDIKQ